MLARVPLKVSNCAAKLYRPETVVEVSWNCIVCALRNMKKNILFCTLLPFICSLSYNKKKVKIVKFLSISVLKPMIVNDIALVL